MLRETTKISVEEYNSLLNTQTVPNSNLKKALEAWKTTFENEQEIWLVYGAKGKDYQKVLKAFFVEEDAKEYLEQLKNVNYDLVNCYDFFLLERVNVV